MNYEANRAAPAVAAIVVLSAAVTTIALVAAILISPMSLIHENLSGMTVESQR